MDMKNRVRPYFEAASDEECQAKRAGVHAARAAKEVRPEQGRKIFVCSPYRPKSKDPKEAKQQLEENILRARLACRFVTAVGHMPMCPHLYFTRFLDDRKVSERELGLNYGAYWLMDADEVWVFGDEITEGMQQELEMTKICGIPVRFIAEPANIVIDMLEEICKAQNHQRSQSISLGRLEIKKGV